MTREEAIEILWRYDVNFEPHPAEKVMHAIDMAIESLKAEIVRCKDCRHYEKFNYEAPSGYDGWCNTPVIYADGHYTNALHFCSWGERREP